MDVVPKDKHVEEKLGSSGTSGHSDNFDYLPIKKRRPRIRSPSPPPHQTPLGDICAPHVSVSDPNPLGSNFVEVQKSQTIESTNLPHTEDSFGIELLAIAACKNNNVDDIHSATVGISKDKLLTPEGTQTPIETLATPACKNNNVDDVHSATLGVSEDRLLTPEGTQTPTDMSSFGKTTACLKGEMPSLKDSVLEAQTPIDVSSFGKSTACLKREMPSPKDSVLEAQTPMDMSSFGKTTACLKGEMPSLKDSVLEAQTPMDMSSFVKTTACIKGEIPSLKDSVLEAQTPMDMSSFGKTTASIKGGMPSLEDSALEAHNNSPGQTDSTTVSLNFLDNANNNAEKCSSSDKDVKFHWDLNTVMDEWELPVEDQHIDPTGNCMNISCEGLQSVVSDELHKSAGVKKSEDVWKLSKCKSDISGPAQLVSKSKFFDNGSSSVGRINTSTQLTMRARDNLCTSGIQLGQTLALINVKLEKKDDVLVNSTVSDKSEVSDKSVSEMGCVKFEEEPIISCNVPSVGNSVPRFIIPASTTQLSSISEKAALPNFLSGNKMIAPPVTTLDQCQPVINYVKKENDIRVPPKVAPVRNSLSDVEMTELVPKTYDRLGPPKVATLVNSSSDVETKELMPKSDEHFGEVALEDPLDDGDVSDLSLGGHDHLVRLGKATKHATGGESPFEDGELREPVALSWEENECETECLHYDIDDRDAYDFDTGNHCMSEAGSESIQNEAIVNLTKKGTCGSADSVKESSNSASIGNVFGQDQIATAVEADDGKTDEAIVSDSIRRLDCNGSFTEDIQSGATRAKFASRVGECPASIPFDEKNTIYMQQGRSGSRFQAGQEFRCDKFLGRDRRIPQVQDARHKDNWNGSPSSFIESRHDFQDNYRRGGILPLPRSRIKNSDTEGEGLAYHDQRRSTNFSTKGGYRPLAKRRPLDSSDIACSTHKVNIEARDNGHGMNRGRSGTYQRAGCRGRRGPGPNHCLISNESAPFTAWIPERRRRSSSPIRNRNPAFSRSARRSRSRSRTRSPIPWRQQEERNKGPRMERTRIHYDSKFDENDEAFCSPPRKRFSSQDNSGFFTDRNSGPSRFRGRNSPGRFVEQRQRFDARGSVERIKPDDGFSPIVHPRFTKSSSGEFHRGRNYDNNNNERIKYSYRNETIRRDRHGENSGNIRRFRSNADDCFNGNNNRNDNGWEGRGSFKYDRDRM